MALPSSDTSIPLASNYTPASISQSMSNAYTLAGQKLNTENQIDARNDKNVMQDYLKSGGDLYSQEGIDKAVQSLKGKVSPGAYQELVNHGQKFQDWQIGLSEKFAAAPQHVQDSLAASQDMIVSKLEPVLQAYDNGWRNRLKARNLDPDTAPPGDVAEAKEAAKADYEAAKMATIQAAGQQQYGGRQLLDPALLQQFQGMDPDAAQQALQRSKFFQDRIKHGLELRKKQADTAKEQAQAATATQKLESSIKLEVYQNMLREVTAGMAEAGGSAALPSDAAEVFETGYHRAAKRIDDLAAAGQIDAGQAQRMKADLPKNLTELNQKTASAKDAHTAFGDIASLAPINVNVGGQPQQPATAAQPAPAQPAPPQSGDAATPPGMQVQPTQTPAPVEQTPLAAPPATGNAPIDKGRPIIHNPDGSFSTERTITIGADGKFFNIPTIVGGKQLTPEQAIETWKAGKNPPVGEFNTQQEAEAAAKARSAQIGQERGVEAGQPQDTFAGAVAATQPSPDNTTMETPPVSIKGKVPARSQAAEWDKAEKLDQQAQRARDMTYTGRADRLEKEAKQHREMSAKLASESIRESVLEQHKEDFKLREKNYEERLRKHNPVGFEKLEPMKRDAVEAAAWSHLIKNTVVPSVSGLYAETMAYVAHIAHQNGMSVAELESASADVKTQLMAKRTLETRIINTERAENVLLLELPVLERAMKSIDLSKYPRMSEIELAVLREKGDPNVVVMDQSAETILKEFEGVTTGAIGGLTVDAVKAARENYHKIQTPQGMKAWIDNARDMIIRAKTGNEKTRGEVMENVNKALGIKSSHYKEPEKKDPKEAVAPKTKEGKERPTHDQQGRVLIDDGNGNWAYVNPNNPKDYVEVKP